MPWNLANISRRKLEEESIVASGLAIMVQTQRQAIDELKAELRSGNNVVLPAGEMIINRHSLVKTAGHRSDCIRGKYPMGIDGLTSVVFEDEPHVQCIECSRIVSLPDDRKVTVLKRNNGRVIDYEESNTQEERYVVDQISEPISFMESVTMPKPKIANPGGWKSKQKLLDEIGDRWAARDLSALQSLSDLEEELDKVIATI